MIEYRVYSATGKYAFMTHDGLDAYEIAESIGGTVRVVDPHCPPIADTFRNTPMKPKGKGKGKGKRKQQIA